MKKLIGLFFGLLIVFGIAAGARSAITIDLNTGTAFQNDGAPLSADHTALLKDLDDSWGPGTTGGIADYYASGLGAFWLDAISLNFDLSGIGYSNITDLELRFYVQKGDYSLVNINDPDHWNPLNPNWEHYQVLQGAFNTTNEDWGAPAMYNNNYGFIDFYGDWSDIADRGHVFGWISYPIDLSWVTSDNFDVTLRLWNARIDRVELVANTAPAPDCTEDADCDNGIFCDGAETCDTATGTCQLGTPPCDDGVDCTVDVCDEVEDSCTNTPDDTLCDDEELCTSDSCDEVADCVFTPVECPEGQQCDSTDGQCQPLGCTDDEGCDDGFFCNGAETCDTATGTCQPGTPVDCDDGVDCTVDTCDEFDDVCVNTPDDIACPDDGLFCTGDEICDPEAGCVSNGDPCPPGTTCNEDMGTCDMVTGKVIICHKPPGNRVKAKTLRINVNAVKAHLNHGDSLGECP